MNNGRFRFDSLERQKQHIRDAVWVVQKKKERVGGRDDDALVCLTSASVKRKSLSVSYLFICAILFF